MSLHHIANHLATKGRNGDSTLVHMTHGEVAGLQALAQKNGTSMTINPHTGLPEAFSLKSLIPMAAGVALTVGSGGALSPLAAGMLVGGGYWASTGSLKQGLMAGLGAYGGAGLGGGIAGMGAEAGTQMAAGEADAAAAEAAKQEAAKQAALQEASTGVGAPTPWSPTVNADVAAQSARDYASNAAGNTYELTGGYRPTFGPEAMGPQVSGATTPAMVPANTGFSQATQQALANPMQTGAQSAFSNPGTYVDKLGGGMQAAKYGVASLAPAIGDAMTPDPLTPLPKDTDMGQRYSYQPGYPTGKQGYTMISNEDAKKLYGFAEGGEVGYKYDPVTQNFASSAAPAADGIASIPAKGYGYDPVTQRFTGAGTSADYLGGGQWGKTPEELAAEQASTVDYGGGFAAGGGISSLGGYSDGGRMLKGPGDGMSDSIPAQIGSKQPARLADGEFVVPADVVSHLGNGSTDAGAKQLYKMMDKIRTARTGRKSQGKQINPNKFVPA